MKEGYLRWISEYQMIIRAYTFPFLIVAGMLISRFGPPKLQFLTKVYHCNIAPTGAICKSLSIEHDRSTDNH